MSNHFDTNLKAMQILARLQKSLHRRLARFVTENEAMLRQAATGAEGYGYTLQQLDELFLSRLNLIERTMAELHKSPAQGVSRYRSLVFSASRDNVESEVNSRLDRIPSARILGITVSPASASSKVTYQFSELGADRLNAVRGELAEDEGDERADEASDEALRADEEAHDPRDPQSSADSGEGYEDLDEEYGYPGSDSDEEYLVTVLYYGPAAASGA